MNRFKELSKEFGYKQIDFQNLINLSIDVINNISNNRSSIDDEKLIKLCDIFQVTCDYFLCLTNEGIYVDVLGKRYSISKDKFLLYKSMNKISYPNGIRSLLVSNLSEIEFVESNSQLIKLKNELF